MPAYDPFSNDSKISALMTFAESVASPLAALATDLAAAAESLERPDISPQPTSSIRTYAKRIGAMAETLAEFAGLHPCRPSSYDFAVALNDLMPVLRQLAGENIALKVDIPADIGPIFVDLFLLEQTLCAFIVKSCHFIPDTHSVLIAARRSELSDNMDEPPRLIVEVIVGAAINADLNAAKLFEPVVTSSNHGFQIGLAYVLGLTKAMNTRLSVEILEHHLTFRLAIPSSPS